MGIGWDEAKGSRLGMGMSSVFRYPRHGFMGRHRASTWGFGAKKKCVIECHEKHLKPQRPRHAGIF